jgi:AP-2 complex subunit mu-1
MQGMSECSLQAEAERSSTTHGKAWSRPPIEVDYQVLMFTSSGLLVRYLKVFEKSNCESAFSVCNAGVRDEVLMSMLFAPCLADQSVKWVRYLSRANGSYLIRF